MKTTDNEFVMRLWTTSPPSCFSRPLSNTRGSSSSTRMFSKSAGTLKSDYFLHGLTRVVDPYVLYKYDRLKDSESLKVDDSFEGHYELGTGKLYGLCHCCFGPFKWELGSFNAEILPENEDYFALLTCCLLKGKVFKHFNLLSKEYAFNAKTLNKNHIFESQSLLLMSDYLKSKEIATPEKLTGLKLDNHFKGLFLALIKAPAREKVAAKFNLLFAS
jgi:hypothetical protein